ncbi:MAG: hypothetical protein VYB65_12270 [Myxococcota bacterium]|nr:hypothetical protein [Myxococcota bacterium]
MIQNESLPVWHYGRGRALTTGRITYTGGDPADLASYRIEGALKWTRLPGPGGIVWRAQLDADGITPIIYASADLLSSTAGSEDIQAMVITFDGDVSTGAPAHVDATLRDLTDPESGTDLAEDQALCITVIVSQIGPPQYSEIPLIGAPPLPPGPPERIVL